MDHPGHGLPALKWRDAAYCGAIPQARKKESEIYFDQREQVDGLSQSVPVNHP
jgi:hypothetical protein